jgi:hypothetical protein
MRSQPRIIVSNLSSARVQADTEGLKAMKKRLLTSKEPFAYHHPWDLTATSKVPPLGQKGAGQQAYIIHACTPYWHWSVLRRSFSRSQTFHEAPNIYLYSRFTFSRQLSTESLLCIHRYLETLYTTEYWCICEERKALKMKIGTACW